MYLNLACSLSHYGWNSLLQCHVWEQKGIHTAGCVINFYETRSTSLKVKVISGATLLTLALFWREFRAKNMENINTHVPLRNQRPSNKTAKAQDDEKLPARVWFSGSKNHQLQSTRINDPFNAFQTHKLV